MSADPTPIKADIAIVGGGLVGASLAYALAIQGWQVAMIESVSPRAESQPSYDDRTLALADSSCRIGLRAVRPAIRIQENQGRFT